MSYPQYPGVQDKPAPPKRRFPIYGWVFLGILGLAVAAGVALNLTKAPTPAQAVEVAPVAAPAVSAPAGPRTEFGDGTWIVGVDIQPGTYRSLGAAERTFSFCHYSRLKEPTSDSDTLSWGTASVNEPVVIEVKPADGAFKASGCEPFTKVG